MRFLKPASALLIIATLFLGFSNNMYAQQQVVTIQPEKPQPGETVTLTYHPEAPDAKITEPDSLMLVLSYAPGLFSIRDELVMNNAKNGWSVQVPLSERFAFGSFYFKSDKVIDKNVNGHHYTFFAYQNKTPARDAYLSEIGSLSKRYKDAEEAKLDAIKAHLYAKTLAIHPKYYNARIGWISFLLSQEHADSTALRKRAHQIIQARLADNPKSLIIIRDVMEGYKKIGQQALGDSVEQAMIEKYPKSDIAMHDLYQRAMDEENKDKRANMLQRYVSSDYEQSYMNKYYTGSAYKKLFEYYAKQQNVEKMKAIAPKLLQPNPRVMDDPIISDNLNDGAQIIAKNTDRYEWALEYAQKALSLTDEEPAWAMAVITKTGTHRAPISEEVKEERLKSRKTDILATIGLIYIKQEKFDEAEKILRKAKELSDNKTVLKKLAKLYTQTNRPKLAYDIYWELLLKKPTNDGFHNKLKKSYIAYNGSAEGFDQKTEKLDALWHKKMVAKFKKEIMDKKAPSLEHVTDLRGNPLDLSSLKNKVVIVDFWATWCGPCMSSFPYMQKVYEKYADNLNVKFIILNSAWSNSIKDARKWKKEGEYAKNDYTFPLYYDKNSKVTTAFGVRGIPTTFILGKDGDIKFKHVGYPGPGLEKKLTLRIEMILNGAEMAMSKTNPK